MFYARKGTVRAVYVVAFGRSNALDLHARRPFETLFKRPSTDATRVRRSTAKHIRPIAKQFRNSFSFKYKKRALESWLRIDGKTPRGAAQRLMSSTSVAARRPARVFSLLYPSPRSCFEPVAQKHLGQSKIFLFTTEKFLPKPVRNASASACGERITLANADVEGMRGLFRRRVSTSAARSPTEDWPCRRSVSSPDRRTNRAWSACL
jgi:hypothetical protein